MSATLAITVNIFADLMIIGLLAFVMAQARHLTPHATPSDEGVSEQSRTSARQRQPRRLTGIPAVVSPECS